MTVRIVLLSPKNLTERTARHLLRFRIRGVNGAGVRLSDSKMARPVQRRLSSGNKVLQIKAEGNALKGLEAKCVPPKPAIQDHKPNFYLK